MTDCRDSQIRDRGSGYLYRITLGELKSEVQNGKWDEMVNLAQMWHSGVSGERRDQNGSESVGRGWQDKAL